KYTALHYTLTVKRLSCANYLIEQGARHVPEFNPQNNERLLPHAAKQGLYHLVEWLLDKGVPVDATDGLEEFEQTALFFSVKSGRVDIARKLLERNPKTAFKVKIGERGYLEGPCLWHLAAIAQANNTDEDLLSWLQQTQLPIDAIATYKDDHCDLQLT